MLELVLAEVFSADVELLSAFSVVVVVEELEITLLIKDSISLVGMLLPFSSRTVIATADERKTENDRQNNAEFFHDFSSSTKCVKFGKYCSKIQVSKILNAEPSCTSSVIVQATVIGLNRALQRLNGILCR